MLHPKINIKINATIDMVYGGKIVGKTGKTKNDIGVIYFLNFGIMYDLVK